MGTFKCNYCIRIIRKSLLINKTKRLLIPYILVGLLYQIPLKYIVGKGNLKENIIDLITCQSADQLWFILSLFLMFLMIYALNNILNKKPIFVVLLSLLLLGLSYLIEYLQINYLFLTSTFRCFIFFVLGYLFRKYNTNIIRKIKPIIILLMYVCIFIVAMLLQKSNNNVLYYIGYILYYSTFLIFPELFFGALLNIFEKLNTYTSKLSVFLSKHSMNMYLFHQQIIYFFIVFINNSVHPILLVVISFSCSFIISLLISILCKTNKITRFITGDTL